MGTPLCHHGQNVPYFSMFSDISNSNKVRYNYFYIGPNLGLFLES
jgi:hypothetical protein